MLICYYSSIIYSSYQTNKVEILSDASGYYLFARLTSNVATFWKYLFANSSSAQWQNTTPFIIFMLAQSMINDSQIYISGVEAASPYALHHYKISFGSNVI